MAALGAAFSFAAQAGAVCGDRGDLVRQLRDRHAEKTVAIASTATGAVVEVYASAAGTWTLLLTAPGGISCVLATGRHWRSVEGNDGKGTAL